MNFPSKLKNMKIELKKIVLIIVLFVVSVPCALAQSFYLQVGEKSKIMEVSPTGWYSFDNVSWTVTNPSVELTGSGLYRYATIKSYFSTTATVVFKCRYRLTSSSQWIDFRREWSVSCINNQITISPDNISDMSVGSTRNLSYSFSLTPKTTPSLSWQTSNRNVVAVSNGVVTAVGPGSAEVLVTTNIGKESNICYVTVKKVDPTGVSLPSSKTVERGKSITLEASLIPSYSESGLEWWSDDIDIATVDRYGKVTGLKTGTTNINVRTTVGGYSAKCRLTVKNPKLSLYIEPAETIYQSGSSITLRSSQKDAKIYYTINGSTPTKSSKVYTGPIKVYESFTLKCFATCKDYEDSDVLSKDIQCTYLESRTWFPGNETQCRKHTAVKVVFNDYIKESKNYTGINLYSVRDGINVPYDGIIEETSLIIIPKKLLGNGEYKVIIPTYALVNSANEPNLESTYTFTVSESESGSIVKMTANTKLMDNGDLYMWNPNGNVSWLFGNNANDYDACKVQHLVLKNIADYYLNDDTNYYLTNEGKLYGWGGSYSDNTGSSILGDFSTVHRDRPVELAGNIESIKVQGWHKGFLCKGGLYLWGRNWNGEIGNGEAGNKNRVYGPKYVMSNVRQFDIGLWETYIINSSNKLYGCGYLGDNVSTPTLISDNVIDVSAGNSTHVAFIKTDGSLWTMGENDSGQLGNGSYNDNWTPKKVRENVKKVICQSQCTWVLDNENRLYMTGYYSSGGKKKSEFTLVAKDVKEIINDWDHGFEKMGYLSNDNNLYIISNDSNGNPYPKLIMDKVVKPYYISSWYGDKAYALREDNYLWGVGSNLCNGQSSDVPVKLELIRNYTNVEKVDVINSAKNIQVGEIAYVRPTIYPSDADFTDYKFETANKDIVKIYNNGVVEGLKPGNAKCTLTVFSEKEEYSKNFDVTVIGEDEADYYLVGSMNVWDQFNHDYPLIKTKDNTELTEYSGEFYFHPGPCQLKFVSKKGWEETYGYGDWNSTTTKTLFADWKKYTVLPFTVTMQEDFLLSNGGSNISFPEDFPGAKIAVKLVFSHNRNTVSCEFLWIRDNSGVEELQNEDKIQFFNLQGVKVDNPEKGIYIKVCGGKREKVIIE